MNVDKWVLPFVNGIGFNKRSNYENEVAYSISNSICIHHKIPYLFVYNYMKMDRCFLINIPKHAEYSEQDGYVKLLLPRLFGENLEEYPTFPEWKSAYRELQTRGEIVVKDKLGDMIENIMRNPSTSVGKIRSQAKCEW